MTAFQKTALIYIFLHKPKNFHKQERCQRQKKRKKRRIYVQKARRIKMSKIKGIYKTNAKQNTQNKDTLLQKEGQTAYKMTPKTRKNRPKTGV